MKNLDFTIVDLETTGLSPTSDRIIEVGALKVEAGRIVERFSTLVNPERPVSSFIQTYTGINLEDLESAPNFRAIRRDLNRLLKGQILVAHNARFDYGFLKNEFKRVGSDFAAKTLCTVRLSRALFPEERRHGLDALMARLGIHAEHRHRALDDALVVWEFLQKITSEFPETKWQRAWTQILQSASTPAGVERDRVAALPERPGVYLFFNEQGNPLYVGKSRSIRKRVRSHFSSDHRRGREMALCRQVHRIEAIPTSGELGALLLESHLIKTLQPWHNRLLRQSRRLVVLQKEEGSGDYPRVRLSHLEVLPPEDLPQFLGIFRSKSQAQQFLEEKMEEYQLCSLLLGLEKGKGPCFRYQLKKCRGACCGEEALPAYLARFTQAFHESRLRAWPYPGPVLIEEREHMDQPATAFVIDYWCLVGKLEMDEWNQDVPRLGKYVFDYDAYKILVKFLLQPQRGQKIKVLPREHLPQSLEMVAVEENGAET